MFRRAQSPLYLVVIVYLFFAIGSPIRPCKLVFLMGPQICRLTPVACSRSVRIVYQDREVKVWRVIEVPWSQENIEPGKILDVSFDGILVKCGEDAVRIVEHELIAVPTPGAYFQ